MTKLEKAKILDGLGIEYETLMTGEMVCFVSGEWINAGQYIEQQKNTSDIGDYRDHLDGIMG